MALRRMKKRATRQPAASNIIVASRPSIPRAVSIAARAAYIARTVLNVPDIVESPGSPAIQDPAGDLSLPTSQTTSVIAVMSVSDVPAVLPHVSPVSTEIPVSAEIPASAEIPRTMAPSKCSLIASLGGYNVSRTRYNRYNTPRFQF